jgi:hypothetical protein
MHNFNVDMAVERALRTPFLVRSVFFTMLAE